MADRAEQKIFKGCGNGGGGEVGRVVKNDLAKEMGITGEESQQQQL